MGEAMLISARKAGLRAIDSHLEMESNSKVRAEMEYMGGKVYKVYRVHGKRLQQVEKESGEGRERQLKAVECR
jgi:hypothetical protein